MSNLGYQGAAGRLNAANAVRSQMAMRFAEARDRMDGKTARAAAIYPAYRTSMSLLSNMTGALPAYNPSTFSGLTAEQEEALRSQLDARVQSVMAMIAIMINDAESDTAEMEELLSYIQSMDKMFFDFAENPDEACQNMPPEARKKFVFYYYREFFTTTLMAIKEV